MDFCQVFSGVVGAWDAVDARDWPQGKNADVKSIIITIFLNNNIFKYIFYNNNFNNNNNNNTDNNYNPFKNLCPQSLVHKEQT